jgi:hypothetical protein
VTVHGGIHELPDPLPLGIAVADTELGPLLVIQDEGDRKSRIVGPLDLRRVEGIADQVARHRARP